MQFLSIIGPMVAIAGLVSASVLPVLPILREQEKERQQMGRISNPLAYSSRPQPPVSAIKRADAGFYFCTNADFQGLCFRDQSPFGTCGMYQVLVGLLSCVAIFKKSICGNKNADVKNEI